MTRDDAVRIWVSSIGPGQHDFSKLREMWLVAGNAAVSTAQLGRWLTAAGFARSRTGKAKVTRYARPTQRRASRVDTVAAAPVSTITPQSAPPVDAVSETNRAAELSDAMLLARRFVQAVAVDAHKFSVVTTLFAEWCELAGVDAVDDAVLAAWIADGGRGVDAMRRAA